MGLSAILKNTRRSASLMVRMFDKPGISEQRVAEQTPVALSHALARCASCPGAEACARWLDYTDVPKSAPNYCLNRELMARLPRIVGAGCGWPRLIRVTRTLRRSRYTA